MNKVLVYWVTAVMILTNMVIFGGLMYAVFVEATNLGTQIVLSGASIFNLSMIAGHIWFAVMFDEKKGVMG